MSAADTVRDVVRIASTAGLAKDVIDLLDKKAILLAEQVAALEKDKAALAEENTVLLRENRNLKLENEKLKSQLQNARPKGNELADKTRDILLYFFKKAGNITDQEIAQCFGMEISVAAYHTDVLLRKKLIDFTFLRSPSAFAISEAGRKYVVEHGLAG